MRALNERHNALLLPAKRWRRRLTNLREAYPEPATIPVVDLTRLTPEERWELGRIMAIVAQAGLAACSDWEIDVVICCQQKLTEGWSERCLGQNDMGSEGRA
jgi:hypothetical protein